jgi:hypothetical protein
MHVVCGGSTLEREGHPARDLYAPHRWGKGGKWKSMGACETMQSYHWEWGEWTMSTVKCGRNSV